MGQVKSEKGKAAMIATGIVSAGNNIISAGTVTRDQTSYYTANTVGRRLIINEDSISKNIQGKLSEFVKLIHSVADEFEAVDLQVGTLIQNTSSTVPNLGLPDSSFPYSNPSFTPQNSLLK